ncbi:hypothetical protein APHNP_0216 [Anaplasma phagocytophilum str. ApNP]|uniref:Uncharacterized protein n=1 Tax=Anaplasma phagocytophilum str. ApNP TaxID=1359153 RepID=A0A0F3NIY1_ANAPH|nr:hypothetical protein APHNP_0216 [Anaplasma phagocytophilum str. ApNP]
MLTYALNWILLTRFSSSVQVVMQVERIQIDVISFSKILKS